MMLRRRRRARSRPDDAPPFPGADRAARGAHRSRAGSAHAARLLPRRPPPLRGGQGGVPPLRRRTAERRSSRPAARPAFDSVLLERATSGPRIAATMANRLRNWEAGLRAVADRPLVGWGPHNYHVAAARHLSAPEGRTCIRDHAHNMVVEETASVPQPGPHSADRTVNSGRRGPAVSGPGVRRPIPAGGCATAARRRSRERCAPPQTSGRL